MITLNLIASHITIDAYYGGKRGREKQKGEGGRG